MQLNAQENVVTVGGGYAFAKIDLTTESATGWRINGLYEFNPLSANVSHGISFGYIGLSATQKIIIDDYTVNINSFPIYYAPKIMFGTDTFKGFVKGALGMQFAYYKVERNNEHDDNEFGFYGGAGAGFSYFIKDNIFINAEYEIAFANNQWYDGGWINSAMGGIGIKF
jgi:opacity protein-like surface antigen